MNKEQDEESSSRWDRPESLGWRRDHNGTNRWVKNGCEAEFLRRGTRAGWYCAKLGSNDGYYDDYVYLARDGNFRDTATYFKSLVEIDKLLESAKRFTAVIAARRIRRRTVLELFSPRSATGTPTIGGPGPGHARHVFVTTRRKFNMENLMTPIEEFSQKLATRKGLYDTQQPARKALNDEFIAAIERRWKELHGRKKFKLVEAEEMIPEYSQIKAPFEARAQVLGANQREERCKLDVEMSALAQNLVVVQTTEKSVYSRWSTSDFSTQTCPEKYARAMADQDADHVRRFVSAEVVETNRKTDTYPGIGYSYTHVEFQVMACCDAIGCEILPRKEKPPLRDFVRNCWARGVNPRVINPWIPANYEKENDLDYFGREVAPVDAGQSNRGMHS